MQSLLSNKCDIFSRKFEVFNKMEMEINVIHNKIFTKLYLKIRVGKKNIIFYHFLVKSKPHERTDILITASVNIYQTKIPIIMKPYFFLKVGISPSKKTFFICFIDSPSKMMKNAFNFILKALFVLKIFKFLS